MEWIGVGPETTCVVVSGLLPRQEEEVQRQVSAAAGRPVRVVALPRGLTPRASTRSSEALAALLERVAHVLVAVEHSNADGACPYCGTKPHTDHCALAAVMGKARALGIQL